ncbi:MAG: hypothetical protein KC461_11930 [Dehalococcoidia bacterium]|nr:hypothetical protein [Dehalococcoidia bacterium]MCA9857049.1 hypothetical protein [Dehalococcoidia bacterium]MCB9483386.1 hypothetical protein [Dehalococcoidia bacterium]MCB9492287.1 hypothetical protein [Dehalococcoidia bacterium]
MIVDQEAQGCASVAAALEVLAEREPELRERFRLDKTARSAQTGGSAQWCIAYQLGVVTNPADTTGTIAPRVAAQLTLQHRNSEALLFAVAERRDQVEATIGHRLSWLPGGESGGKLRSIIRSWRPMEGSPEELGAWMAEEMVRLREALAPALEAAGVDAP